MGLTLCTWMLESACNARAHYVILPALLHIQGHAGLFKLAPALLTQQGSPSAPLLSRCQKDLRLLSLAEERA